jgi:hypothetical protein
VIEASEPARIKVDYPVNGSIFPPEITPPRFFGATQPMPQSIGSTYGNFGRMDQVADGVGQVGDLPMLFLAREWQHAGSFVDSGP